MSYRFLPFKAFLKRFSTNLLLGLTLILCSLGVGMVSYRYLERMSWLDAFLNAAMILSGMGPVHEIKSEGGKLFAGTYALFSGIFFLAVTAFVFSPLIHRVLSKFHVEDR